MWIAGLTVIMGLMLAEQITAFQNKNKFFNALTWLTVRVKNLEDKVKNLEKRNP
jgi:hypothetical protein